MREWYGEEHANLVKVDAKKSKWWVWNQTTDIAKDSVKQIQSYLQRVADGKRAFVLPLIPALRVYLRNFIINLHESMFGCDLELALESRRW